MSYDNNQFISVIFYNQNKQHQQKNPEKKCSLCFWNNINGTHAGVIFACVGGLLPGDQVLYRWG